MLKNLSKGILAHHFHFQSKGVVLKLKKTHKKLKAIHIYSY